MVNDMSKDARVEEYVFDCLSKEPMEIPDIVTIKAGEAFDRIHRGKTMTRRKKMWSPIVAACLTILLVGGVTVGAVTFPRWSSTLQAKLFATEEQQHQMYAKGMMTQLSDVQPVTHDGITVTPMEIIADDYTIYMTFHVEGIPWEKLRGGKNVEYDFRSIYFRLAEDDRDIASSCSCSIIDAEHQDFVVVANCTNENILQKVTGQDIHIRLEKMEAYPAFGEKTVWEDAWEFDVTLPDGVTSLEYPVNRELPGGIGTLRSIIISPISIRILYEVNEHSSEYIKTILGENPTILDTEGNEILTGDGSTFFGDWVIDNSRVFQNVINPEDVTEIRINVDGEIMSIDLKK